MAASIETQHSNHPKSTTFDSNTATHSDEYSGFIKTSSPTALRADTDSDSFYDDEIIPPTHTHRTLVLCFDGTGILVSPVYMRDLRCLLFVQR